MRNANLALQASFGRFIQDHCQSYSCLREPFFHYCACLIPVGRSDHKMFMQHALADIVIVCATAYRDVRLDREWFAQSSISCFYRMIVAFPSPGLQLHPALLPGWERTREGGVQCVCKLDGIRSLHLAFGNFRVPNMMEIRSVGIVPGVRISLEVFDGDAISATVAAGRAVQRLVQVAH